MVRALNLVEARTWLDHFTPDIAVVDTTLSDGKGTVLLHPDKNRVPFPLVLLTEAGSEAEVVDAIKAGAVDYLIKSPELLANLPRVVDRALRQWGYVIRQRLTEDALRESEDRFRSIFTTAAAGMVLISPFHNVIQVNPAFCRFIGCDEAELLNRSIFDFTHPDDREKIQQLYDAMFSQQLGSADCERRYLRKDGTTVWGHVSVACVTGGDGRPSYCIALVQDISLRKALEEKLLLANRELDAFVHTVSHDLRSPLTPIIGYLQFIFEEHADLLKPPLDDLLQEVLKEGERMHAMLEDLLALATVGSVTPPSEPVSGDDIMRTVLLRYSACMDNGQDVRFTSLPDILMPRTLYLQIIDNLVGNALHYSRGGSVEVSGSRTGGLVRLSVRDHGPGVADAEKERIFELFYRGVAGKKTTGTGIGLATVKKIALLHNGRAWVEDAPGGGSIFNVELIDSL
jgi:PAS domain S-box-containing protein